ALQLRRDLVDAFERSLVESRFINRPLDEHKVVAVETHQFFRPITDQPCRHCVQQFVGKMDAGEWFHRAWPLHLIAKRLDIPALLPLQDWKWLDYLIAQRIEEIRQTVLRELENIHSELTVVRPLLDDHKIIGFVEAFPDFGELRGQQLPKKRP